MKFALIDKDNEQKEITVKSWDDQQRWGCDEFRDLETQFPASHEKLAGSDLIACTEEEYNELVEWWTNEINAMNNCTVGDADDYTDCAPSNLTLFAD